jgi:hypothetical protein
MSKRCRPAYQRSKSWASAPDRRRRRGERRGGRQGLERQHDAIGTGLDVERLGLRDNADNGMEQCFFGKSTNFEPA